jgi:hypothetical protein
MSRTQWWRRQTLCTWFGSASGLHLPTATSPRHTFPPLICHIMPPSRRSAPASTASLAVLWLALAALAAGAQPHAEVQHQALRPTPTLQDRAPAAWLSDGSSCEPSDASLAHAQLCDAAAAAGPDKDDEDGGRDGLEMQQPLGSLVRRQDPPGGQSLTAIVTMSTASLTCMHICCPATASLNLESPQHPPERAKWRHHHDAACRDSSSYGELPSSFHC